MQNGSFLNVFLQLWFQCDSFEDGLCLPTCSVNSRCSPELVVISNVQFDSPKISPTRCDHRITSSICRILQIFSFQLRRFMPKVWPIQISWDKPSMWHTAAWLSVPCLSIGSCDAIRETQTFLHTNLRHYPRALHGPSVRHTFCFQNTDVERKQIPPGIVRNVLPHFGYQTNVIPTFARL